MENYGNIEKLFFTVILVVYMDCVFTTKPNCTTINNGNRPECSLFNRTLQDCYYKVEKIWNVEINCRNWTELYTCINGTWNTTATSVCSLTDTSTATETYGPTTGTSITSEEVTTQSDVSTESNTILTTISTETNNTSEPTSSYSESSTVASAKTTSEPAEKESTDNTTEGRNTSESHVKNAQEYSDSDDKAPVVAAAVSVSVVAVILVVLIVVFLLWRKRRQKSTPAAGLHSGNLLTNRSYEDRHGLDRHISLLNIRSNQSVDSGYAEISLENLRSEETTGNVYQTIDILPDDQIECNGNYGHLEMKTTAFVDNSYSHIPINQANGNVQQDSTYAHTGGATLKPDMENKGQDSENTYNILESMPHTTIREQKMDKVHESNTDENESEYNHATAGRSDSSGSKPDTYSHLNRTWQNRPANSHNDMKPISEGGENRSHNNKGEDSDFGKANDEKNIPEYAKCIKKKKDTENPRKVGSDGYEKASGIAHEYFVLEPDNATVDSETSFRVIEDNCLDNQDDTADAENPYHQYFTLEKTN